MVRLILFVFLGAHLAHAQTTILAEKKFDANVKFPSKMVICNDSLWVYSSEDLSLHELNLTSGVEKAKHDLPLQLQKPAVLSCWKNELVFLQSRSMKSEAKLVMYNTSTKVINSKHKLPEVSRVTDFNCFLKVCYMVADGVVYVNDDEKTWKAFPVPPSAEIVAVDSQKSINPFDDWQDKQFIGNGKYTKLVVFNGQVTLLDPIRSVLVVKSNSGWKRWSDWGAWEGQLLSPIAIAVAGPDHLLVSDTTLKKVIAFDKSGNYAGILSEGDDLLSFDRALSLYHSNALLYVADHSQNKVSAYKMDWKPRYKKSLVRVNLFRRKEVQEERITNKCLKCHDGTIAEPMDNIIKAKTSHVFDKTYEKSVELPLHENGRITCATCHNPHHGNALKSEATLPQDHPPYLRKEWRPLCLSCHVDKTGPPNNHPDKTGESCIKCHQVHGGINKLLRKEVPQLCWSCHQQKKGEHRSVENLLEIEKAKGIVFNSGQISCTTCHSQHSQNLEAKLLIPKNKILPFCASCHGEKTENLYSNYHNRVRKVGK